MGQDPQSWASYRICGQILSLFKSDSGSWCPHPAQLAPLEHSTRLTRLLRGPETAHCCVLALFPLGSLAYIWAGEYTEENTGPEQAKDPVCGSKGLITRPSRLLGYFHLLLCLTCFLGPCISQHNFHAQLGPMFLPSGGLWHLPGIG